MMQKYTRIFVRVHYLLRTVFRERSSRKTTSFEEQIVSEDTLLSVFSRQIDVIVLIVLQVLFATRGDLKIGEYHFT